MDMGIEDVQPLWMDKNSDDTGAEGSYRVLAAGQRSKRESREETERGRREGSAPLVHGCQGRCICLTPAYPNSLTISTWFPLLLYSILSKRTFAILMPRPWLRSS